MKNKCPGVIVIGGHVQGLGIIRVFGKRGIPVVLFDITSINISRYSKYCLKFYKYPEQNLLEFLLKSNIKEIYSDWLIIPTNDLHVKVLSQNRDLLLQYYKVSTDAWDSISQCYNKINTYKLASRIDIKIPETYFPVSLDDVSNCNIGFPCIIKPAVMHEFYSKLKKKVFLCNNMQELRINYIKATDVIPAEQIIIQEVIQGSGENQYSACFLYLNGKAISHLTARRKRQHPIDFGNATTFAEVVELPIIEQYSEQLLKKINYNGLCEVEFKWDAKGNNYKFLEINPRTWKWHLISEKAGVNFLINLYNFHYNKPFVIDNTSPDSNVCWRHYITDIPVVLELWIKGQFVKSRGRKVQHATWDSFDILPALFEFLFFPILLFKR